MSQKRVLITGGAGFIGSHIGRYWAEQGAKVIVLDSLRSGHRQNLEAISGDLEFVEGCVENASMLLELCQRVDVVHHLAAIVSVPESVLKPQLTEVINTQGTINVLEAARKASVHRVVFSSTSAVYGPEERPIHDETHAPRPVSPYAVTKLAGEYWMKYYREHFGLETVCLRYFNVYGPRQDPRSAYAAAIAIFADKAKENAPITIYGDGKQTRDFVFVEDVVAANVLAATAQIVPPMVMNVATSASLTITELAEKVIHFSGSKSLVVYADPRPGDIVHSRGKSDLLRAQGWAPKVHLDEGLQRTLASFWAGAERVQP
ncbi:MAG: NAD-dependent epimerase/dehydratase family protein [Sumerlaeia bacterium]